MVNGQTLAVHGLIGGKNDRRIFKILTELNEQFLIGPGGKRAVGLAVYAVQEQTAGTLQKIAFIFGRGIVIDILDQKTLLFQTDQNLFAPFATAVFSKNRIERQIAILMRSDPIIGKDGVWRIHAQVVVLNNDIHPRRPQFCHKGIKLFLGLGIYLGIL